MAKLKRQEVLVIGEDTRSFLSVIRSLGQAGYTIDVVCYDRLSPALQSKYIRNAYFYNYQAYTPEQWLAEVIALNKQNNYQAIVPCDERAIFPLYANQQLFPDPTVLAIPNQEVIEHLFDKSSTRALAKQLGIAHAHGRLMSLRDIQYQDLIKEFGNKFVIKPTLSFKSAALSKRQQVVIIETESGYLNWCKHADQKDSLLVESYFNGTGEGVSVLAIDGQILRFFAHKRVNEPKSGGGSSYRQSIHLDPSMAQACVKLCQATKYTGVGMFEFKKNYQTGEWILIEVNARFWGSLPLAIYAGIDFPTLYIDSIISKAQGTYEAPTALNKHISLYKTKVYARSLISDLFDMKKEFEFNRKHKSTVSAAFTVMQRLLSFTRIFLGKEHIDSFEFRDLGPFKAEIKRFYLDTLANKLPHLLRPKDRKQKYAFTKLLEAFDKAQPNTTIKFICYGNIMRSPFAQRFLQKSCDAFGLNWQIDSYGFHLVENRQSPSVCLQTAKKFDIALEYHQSKWLRQEHIAKNDILFIFDDFNQDKISRFYQTENVFNLATFIPDYCGTFNSIDDPYGSDERGVENCYKLIAEALNNILHHFNIQKNINRR